jgi:type IX secretion system PorP/SprF family membrane protein
MNKIKTYYTELMQTNTLLCNRLVIVFLFLCSSLFAQDIHFSQLNFSPLNQNPANTNCIDCDFRFVANYKNQWQNVPVRFNTFSISAEGNFATLSNGDRVGGGLLFYFDRGGDSRFTSLNTAFSLSYVKTLDKKRQHLLSGGLQFGVVNRNINYAQLNFDNQWNGDVFDPNIAVNENFGRNSFNFFDLGAGIVYRWKKNERQQLTLGFAATHLNTPSQTLFNDRNVKLNPRFTVHARGQIKVAKRVDLVPELMYQQQDSKLEIVYGAHAKYYIPAKSSHTIALNIGAYGRSAEAMWPFAGVDFDNLQVNLSYDVNLSRLRAASRANGGFEVSVIYLLCRVKKINKPGAVCPAFL